MSRSGVEFGVGIGGQSSATQQVNQTTNNPDEEWQKLVHGHQEEIVIPGLPTPLHIVLTEPIGDSSDTAGIQATDIREKGGVEQEKNNNGQ